MENWFLCKIKYVKVQIDGEYKKVTEQYVVNAVSFTDAEEIVVKEVSKYVSMDLGIAAIIRMNISEVVNIEGTSEKWFKCKLNIITVNEVNGKEKKTSCYWLVNADSVNDAHKAIEKRMSDSTMDYSIEKIDETKIVDLFINGNK